MVLARRLRPWWALTNYRERGTCVSSLFGSNDDQHLLPFPDDTREERCKKLERPKHHFFDGLSPELKFEIFSYLSFDELLNMRLVYRNLALLATVDTFPQLYWRSRFLLGQEADFLFPRLTDKWDWSQLFFWTRASLRAILLPLVNRKRIWQLLEPIAARGPKGCFSKWSIWICLSPSARPRQLLSANRWRKHWKAASAHGDSWLFFRSASLYWCG